jgi:hypothetical protein
LFDKVLLREGLRNQNLFGDEFVFAVILMEKRRENLLVRKAFGRKSKTLAS